MCKNELRKYGHHRKKHRLKIIYYKKWQYLLQEDLGTLVPTP